jgi:hypothetical protein
MSNFYKGEELFYNKQYLMAITFFDRSIHWYTPFNPYIERSAEYLWQIGEQAEHDGDKKLSLIAFESIRNSYYSARNFYSPGTVWIRRCDHKMQQINDQKKMISGLNILEDNNAINVSRMEYNDPGIFWTIILELGLFGWIGSMISFIIFGLGSVKKPGTHIGPYHLWVLLAGLFYSLWIIGMVYA